MASKTSVVNVCRHCGSEDMEENRVLGYFFCNACRIQGEKISIDAALKDQYDKNSTQYTITGKKENQAILGKKSAVTEQKEFHNLRAEYYRYFNPGVPEEIRDTAYSLYLIYKNAKTKNRGKVRLRIIAGFISIVGETLTYPFCESELTKMIEAADGVKKDYKIKDGINKVIAYCNAENNGYKVNPAKDKFVKKYVSKLTINKYPIPENYVEMIREIINKINFKQDNDFVKHHLSSITAAIILHVFNIMEEEKAETSEGAKLVRKPEKKAIADILGITIQKITAATNLLRDKNIIIDLA